MKGLNAGDLYYHTSWFITSLLFALTTWFGRKSFMRTRGRYFLVVLLYVVLAARVGVTQTGVPLAFRVIQFLCIAFLVIMVLVAWPRGMT